MNIKAIRLQLYMTQEQFADLLGVSRMTVSSWEQGRRKVSLAHQKKIVEVCKENKIKVATK